MKRFASLLTLMVGLISASGPTFSMGTGGAGGMPAGVDECVDAGMPAMLRAGDVHADVISCIPGQSLSNAK